MNNETDQEPNLDNSEAADKPTTEEVAAPEPKTDAEAAEPTVEELQARLAEVEAEAEQHRDQFLRARADADNAIKRMEREADKARKFALERFAGELLAVLDSMEMGLAAAESATVESLKEGAELTLKMLQSAVGKHGVTAVEPEGERFDPQLHEAMSMVPAPDADPNTVINVVQKGYTLNGRLLRPARVIVAAAPPAAAEANDESGQDE